jgi:hypothetical protein
MVFSKSSHATAERIRATSATFGMPKRLDVVKLASISGGLMRRPRLAHMAVDWTIKLIDRVAMIGGILKSLISA